MGKSPAFQFYVQDFLLGTRFLTNEEVGGLIKLLCEQWDKGGLPDDDEKLMKLTGVRKKALAEVRKKFKNCEDGLLRNDRLEQVRAEQQNYREKKAEAGRLSGVARRKLSGTNVEQPLNSVAANANPSSSPSPSSSSSDYFKREPVVEKGFEVYDDEDTIEQGWVTNPHWRDVGPLPQDMVDANLLRLKTTRSLLITEEQLSSCWDSFKQLTLNGEQHYKTRQHLYNHFGNWVKNENFNKIIEQLPTYGGYYMKSKEPPADPRWKKMMERYGSPAKQ